MACRCEDESIDELAAFLGVGDEVAAMTARHAPIFQDQSACKGSSACKGHHIAGVPAS